MLTQIDLSHGRATLGDDDDTFSDDEGILVPKNTTAAAATTITNNNSHNNNNNSHNDDTASIIFEVSKQVALDFWNTITDYINEMKVGLAVLGIAIFLVVVLVGFFISWTSSVLFSKHADPKFDAVFHKLDNLESRSVPSFVCDEGFGPDENGVCYPSHVYNNMGRNGRGPGGGVGDGSFGHGYMTGNYYYAVKESGGHYGYFNWLLSIFAWFIGIIIIIGITVNHFGIDTQQIDDKIINVLNQIVDAWKTYNENNNNNNSCNNSNDNPPQPLSPPRVGTTATTQASVAFMTPPRPSHSTRATSTTSNQRRTSTRQATPHPNTTASDQPVSKKQALEEARKRAKAKVAEWDAKQKAARGATITSPSPTGLRPCKTTSPVTPVRRGQSKTTTPVKTPSSTTGTSKATVGTPSTASTKSTLSKKAHRMQMKENARIRMKGA